MSTLVHTGDPKTAQRDAVRGIALLDDPIRNKGTAFTRNERAAYGLEGLLPHAVETLDRQRERVLEHLDAKPTDLERYIYLIALADQNETLFYHTLMSDPARFLPIIYDPIAVPAPLVQPGFPAPGVGPPHRVWR